MRFANLARLKLCKAVVALCWKLVVTIGSLSGLVKARLVEQQTKSHRIRISRRALTDRSEVRVYIGLGISEKTDAGTQIQATMKSLSCEVTINKPVQHVWDYVNNPGNLQLWLNDFVRYEHLTGDQQDPKAGDTSAHTYSQNGKEFTMKETITAIDPPHHIKLFMSSNWFDMNIVNTFEAVSDSKTRLFAGADFVRLGWVMKIFMLFSSTAKMQADHERQIQTLKRLIEAQPV